VSGEEMSMRQISRKKEARFFAELKSALELSKGIPKNYVK
jgi:hypothetical protein